MEEALQLQDLFTGRSLESFILGLSLLEHSLNVGYEKGQRTHAAFL